MKSKITIISCIVGGLLIGGIIFLVVHSSNQFKGITNYPLKHPTTAKVVAFGDSLTAGVGATKGHDYVSDLSEELGTTISQPIINKGRAGDTTAQALARIAEVEQEQPDVVIVYLGGNDFLQNIAPDTTFINLEKIITKLQDKGALVIVIGIRGGLLGDPYKARFDDITSRYHTYYIPDLMLDILDHSNFMYDSVHPNDAGYAYLAEHVYEKIKGIFK